MNRIPANRWRTVAKINGKWSVVHRGDSKLTAERIARQYRVDGYEAFAASGASRIKKNPVPASTTSADIARAKKLFKAFAGRDAENMVRIELPPYPKAGLVFGQCFRIGYVSARDGKPYQHDFKESSRPSLIASPDGKLVLIVGGRFTFTDRGIVDK